jgi:hypothetical protein
MLMQISAADHGDEEAEPPRLAPPAFAASSP